MPPEGYLSPTISANLKQAVELLLRSVYVTQSYVKSASVSGLQVLFTMWHLIANKEDYRSRMLRETKKAFLIILIIFSYKVLQVGMSLFPGFSHRLGALSKDF